VEHVRVTDGSKRRGAAKAMCPLPRSGTQISEWNRLS
jgi:hypothetical protein